MASHLISRAPQCRTCIRRVEGLGIALAFPARQQIRGKKQLAKDSSVKVQLLQNVPGYGRKGSVVPVAPGVMRNIWFPKKMAEYVTSAKLQTLQKEDISLERDPTFGTNHERKAAKAAQPPPASTAAPASVESEIREIQAQTPEDVAIETLLLSPQEATSLLSKLLPRNIDFYRTPIPVEPPKSQPPKRVSPSIPASAAISAAAAEGRPEEAKAKVQEKTSIYGSVSTSDIAANLQAVLAENKEGARIVLLPENISFVGQVADDRIKHLGRFDIEIKLDSSVEAVKRRITVNAQE